MKRTIIAIATALLALGGISAQAAPYSDLYVIPAASHTMGENGTNWRSDIAFHNFQSTPLTIELALIESGEANPDNVRALGGATPVVIPPHGSRILADVLSEAGMKLTDLGAVVVGADRPFAVTSRSYSVTPDGDTVGQTVTPSADFLTDAVEQTPDGAKAYVPGVIANSRFRTNIGFVAGAGTGSPLVLDVVLMGADGTPAGTRRFTIPAAAFMQVQFSSRLLTTAPIDAGAVEFRIVSGDGAVVPYASVIDNATADAVFVGGTFPENMPGASKRSDSPFRALLLQARW